MFQVRIHGRGGQGVVSAAEMLSVAAFEEGKHAQAVPSFGSERMGAPVVAYVRIDDKEIELREPVLEPDLLIVQDPTLFSAIDVFAGLREDGYLLVNTAKTMDELGIGDRGAQVRGDPQAVQGGAVGETNFREAGPGDIKQPAQGGLRGHP